MQREASCSCDQLRVVCSRDPIRVSVCHCYACQKRTGSAFGVQARFPSSEVTISGSSNTYVRHVEDGDSITFHFCAACGSTVYYKFTSDPEVIAVAVGMFNDTGFPVPNFSVYEARMYSWIQLNGDIEHID